MGKLNMPLNWLRLYKQYFRKLGYYIAQEKSQKLIAMKLMELIDKV